MAVVLAGQRVMPTPVTVQAFDNTTNANIASTTYIAGTPETGVTFVAPLSGQVIVTISGGVRNNAANADRVFLAPQIYLGTSSAGTLFLAPAVAQYGCGSGGGYTTDDYQYVCRTSLVTGLTAGSTYYIRVMHATSAGSGTADIAAREITVQPAT
jgi:hypothetical protein